MHRVSRLFGTDQPQPLNAGWRTLSACTLLAAAGLAFTTAAINPAAAAQDRRGTNAQTADLDELKAQIEARAKAMGEDLWRQVAAGEISEADAKARFEEGERRMWMRYRDAEAKTVGGGNSKADYETAVEKMTEMVKAGKITREQMQQRLDRMKQAGMKKTEDIDLKALKARIEERVLAMGVDLRKQVAAGKISEADAKARFEEGEKKMWMRYRAAEEKAAAGGKSMSDYDAAVKKMTEMVEDGTITREQMQQRLDRMKQVDD